MSILTTIITILSYIFVITAGVLVLFIYISLMFSEKITKWRADKIKEKRKEVIKIMLQDLSLFIQVAIGLGIALVLFSLSLKGLLVMIWGFLGLILIVSAVFLLYWRYLPLRNKMYEYYNKETSKKKNLNKNEGYLELRKKGIV